MKKLLPLLLAFSFLAFLFLYYNPYILTPSYAAECDELCQKQAEIAKLEAQLADTKNQEKTLKSQLTLIDGQTQVTTLKIEETNLKIEKLKREITDLSTRIERIATTLDTLSEVLLRRIVQTYRYSDTVSTFNLIFSSQNISDLLGRLKYIQTAQTYDKKKLYELQATKLAYNDQKQDKQTRQIEAEKLNKDLDVYKKQLVNQKRDKDELLKITKNDEAKYQALLAQARAEYLAIQGIIAGRGIENEVGSVNQGQRIATVINSPSCNSGGAHLHFTVVKDGTALNPFNYLNAIDSQNCSGSSCGSSDADPFNPSGGWNWPLNGPIKMNQGYGHTWAVQHTWVGRIYNFHNGIDIEGSSSEVKAVKQGTLFRGSYSGDTGCALPYVRVKHNEEGLETLYLHVYY
ncbi:MAG: hypothetical protein Q7R49_07200 [Candidatus Daviesbacteria bacterium]|nr:hypothetical protein [Candidatus Daviesbacteria bacterium]